MAVWAIRTLDYGSNGRALAVVTGNDVQARLATRRGRACWRAAWQRNRF